MALEGIGEYTQGGCQYILLLEPFILWLPSLQYMIHVGQLWVTVYFLCNIKRKENITISIYSAYCMLKYPGAMILACVYNYSTSWIVVLSSQSCCKPES